MFKRSWSQKAKRWIFRTPKEINPDEIFLDSANLPEVDRDRFEGCIEQPLEKRAFFYMGVAFVLISLLFMGRLWGLQIMKGEVYAAQSEENRLEHSIIFADRGIVYDRNGVPLIENRRDEGDLFSRRDVVNDIGFSHLLGYVSYPRKDSAGFYFQETIAGRAGVEKLFGEIISGANGLKIIETNARGEVQSESSIEPPKNGKDLYLSIDSALQHALSRAIEDRARESGFAGGAGVIMDVLTGELLALTSYPEYDSDILSEGTSKAVIESYMEDPRTPFLNRVVSGLYTPGSIIKPFIAVGVLEEDIVDPEKTFVSTGELRVNNPYSPGDYTVFSDWRAHGVVDLRRALAVSSNVYFYYVGGGYGDQRGLGISNIEHYTRMFKLAEPTNLSLAHEPEGTIPTPAWKKDVFEDDPWRLGDTYNTAIGQYGFQVTPLQVVRAVSAFATKGTMVEPVLLKGEQGERSTLPISKETLEIIREGMRMVVVDERGTARGLNMSQVAIAAKTGTAELGPGKQFVNSWVIGFFPYENPRYAFVVLMERGPRANLFGGVSVMRSFLDNMVREKPQYFGGDLSFIR